MKNRINPCLCGIIPILIVFLGYGPALRADVDFNGIPRRGLRPLVVHFQDLSDYSPQYTREWIFPGGTPGSATGTAPVVQYNAAGVYDVTLQITVTGQVVEELTKEDYIIVFDLIDYGDAMDTIGFPYHYRTMLENDGASHTINNIYLGSLVDAEVDGQPNMAADLDDRMDSDDEDGVTIGDLLAGSTVPVDVEAHNTGYLNVWVDWGIDGDWAEAGDHAVTDLPLVNGPNSVPLPVPPDATPGQSYARFRYSAERGTNWFGHVFNGEVEDYLVYIITSELDFGDAPSPYPTLLAANGARHPVSSTYYLGEVIPTDAEADGQPDASAMGDDDTGVDDENGIAFSPLNIGGTSYLTAVAFGGGMLHAWIDFNADGDWEDPGEKVANAEPMTAMLNTLTIEIPADAVPGLTYARIRYSADQTQDVTGPGGPGEVEDYQVILQVLRDYGDAPEPYPTLSGSGGASHLLSQAVYLGDRMPDFESDGQPAAGALGDDGNGADDEDGVIISLIPPSGSVDIPITVHGDGFLHAWIDFNLDGDWEDPNEKIIDALPLSTSTFVYTLSLPASGVVPGHSMARFRYSQDRSLGSGGPGLAGEVEDYLINIDRPQDYDYGDAPESYGTLDTYHPVSEETYLGATPPDSEGGGMPTEDADGDDTSGPFDDEDGVSLPAHFTPGLTSSIGFLTTGQGTLSAFFDWNRDGDFEDPGECLIHDWIPTLGPTAYANSFTVPVDAVPGPSYARFRFGLPHGVADWGPGVDDPDPIGEGGPGEMEDYPIMIIPVVEIFQDDYGDAPASYEHGDPAYHHLNPDICLGDYIDPEFGPFSAIPGANGDDLDGSPDDEDGATFNYLSPGGVANLIIHTTISEGTQGYLNVWIDLNRDGDWEDSDEHVMDNRIRTFDISTTGYVFPIPETAELGYSFARIRLSTERLSSPFGAGGDGEVEDCPVVILMDYGDAPVSYPSAWHSIYSSYRLGDLIDGEFAANISGGADGDDLQTVDDEDGVSIPVLYSGFPTIIDVNASIPGPPGSTSHLHGWIDYNQDGDWNDLGEHVFDNVAITNGTTARAINVPASALFGETFARFRLNEEDVLGPGDYGGPGEVEDYRVFVADANMDFGDAPDGLGGYHYPTLFAHGGAFHEIVEGMYMGSGVDSETDGTPHINAAGDTDDGVTFSGDFVPGEPFALTITLSMEGHLTVWADWNGDGDWTDCLECLYYNGLFPAGTSVRHPLLPNWISTDKIYFRFRYAVEPLLDSHQFTGYVYGGEVEDYLLDLSSGGSGPPPGLKWSQPPLFSRQSYYDSTYWGWDERSVAGDTILADNWFCGDHRPVKAIRWWGSYADWDSIVPPPEAPDSFRVMIISDLSTDPVRGRGIPGLILWEQTVPRTETGESLDGQDFYPGTTLNPDSVFRYQINLSGSDRFIQDEDSTYFWLSVAAVYTQGEPDSLVWGWTTRETYLLPDAVRLADNPLSWGPELGIEPVRAGWDCAFELLSDLGPQPFDFGDAPDDRYPTSLANNGAHHYVWAGTGLGETRDIEPDSPGNETYSWDDTENTDDEDGIAFQDTLFEPNDIAFVTVHARAGGILNVWADYNGDGDFTDPGERTIIDWPCVRGDNNLAFNIASDVRTEEVAVRFRIAPVAGIRSTGIVIGGEVEDTFVRMQNITAVQEKENQENIPETFRLLQNYPNPFNPSTTIPFHLPERAEVRIIIYNILGRQVRTLVQGEWSPGIHTITWDGRNAFGQQTASGVYIYRIECSQHGAQNGFTQSRKMLLLR